MDIISIRGCFCFKDDLVLRIDTVEKKNISYEMIKFSHPLTFIFEQQSLTLSSGFPFILMKSDQLIK